MKLLLYVKAYQLFKSFVFQTSRLRPEVEPFVPKAQNGQAAFYMVGNGGFSLDAPEFIPNVYNGEMYTWMPNQVILYIMRNIPWMPYQITMTDQKFICKHILMIFGLLYICRKPET